MRYAATAFVGIYFVLNSILTFGQEDAMARSIKERFNMYGNTAVQEKMYLHLDRPLYLVGETIWFKAYNMDGSRNRFLDMSKVAYLEVLDRDNNAVIQTKFSLSGGTGNGAVSIPSAIASGNYKVRGYTSWMKNFSSEYFFETDISIINPFVRFDPAPDAQKEISYDVQFFPEGGYLVKGLESKVAFRAVGPNGKGISFKGVVLDQRNDTLIRFQPSKFGIGNFTLKPDNTDSLRAVITDAAGKQYSYALPRIMEQGYVMQVADTGSNQVKVTVSRNGIDNQAKAYVLAHSRQLNPISDKLTFNGDVAEFIIDRTLLGEGISHITVLNEKLKPLCERLYFKRPEKMLSVAAKVGKMDFTTREKVTLDIAAGQASNLSVSVFMSDSIQALSQDDIASYFLLTSDLQGQVENPSYYFQNPDRKTDAELDNVLISHGWRRFKWENIFGASLPKYEFLPEYDGHLVFGKVLNISNNKPAPGIETYLAPLDFPAKLYTSLSDNNGNILFELKHYTGPKEVTLQTNLLRDSLYKFELASPFSKQFSQTNVTPFYFDKTHDRELLTRSINMQTVNSFVSRLFVERKAVLTDSLAFFGLPDEKYFLDDFTRFPTMEEVLREYVRGVMVRRRNKSFHFRMIDRVIPNTYYRTDPLVLLDGIPIFNIDKFMEIDPLKIKKVELMSSRYFLGVMQFTGIVSFSTYKNDLAGFELDPRVLVTPYDGVQAEREFYSPKYDNSVALSGRMPDFRNLLHWSPNVTTDENGKAQIQFYTSDQTGNYKVVVQGITDNGVAGSTSASFNVVKRTL
jgi:hypothetical protein